MTKGLAILVLSLALSFWSAAQAVPAAAVVPLLKQLAVTKPDSNRVNCLLRLAACYQLRQGENRSDIDSALLLAAEADTLARSVGYRPGIERAALRVCQIEVEINDSLGLAHLVPALSDTNKAKLLLEWGVHYLFLSPIAHKKQIIQFCRQSARIGAATVNKRTKCWSDELWALYYLMHDNSGKGSYYGFRCLNFLKAAGDSSPVQELWDRLLLATSGRDHHADSLMCAADEFALGIAIRDQDYSLMKAIYWDLSDIAYMRRDYARAINYHLLRLDLVKIHHLPGILGVYRSLVQAYSISGDLYHALFYCHEALALYPGNSPDVRFYDFYYQLAGMSLQLGRLNLCIENCKKGLAEITRSVALPGRSKNDIADAYSYQNSIARCEASALSREGRANEGLDLLESYRKAPFHPGIDIPVLLQGIAECYIALKQYDLAQTYFAKSLDKTVNPTAADTLRTLLPLATLYIDKGEPEKAIAPLRKLLGSQSYMASPYRLRDAYYQAYRADSAIDNYMAALKHLKKYKQLNDLLFSLDKNNQREAQQLQFETEARDKDIKMQTQRLQLLQKEEELQQTQLRSAHMLRNMTIVGALLSFLLLALLYSRYRLKRRSARLLEEKQQTVQEKNRMLQRVVAEKEDLLADKDDLLIEKEWLLKEVHHRVKNNLQIVVSLLSMASGSIDNDIAERYISESRDRVYAMALIHQKLYKTDDMESVGMDDYIRDLVAFLDTNYNPQRRIQFFLELEPLTVDVSAAVPLGLIINEAITNAIKHGFPNDRRGEIHVTLAQAETSAIQLTIADNGVGLPSEPDGSKRWSIGMNLMKALAAQIQGSFEVSEQAGVAIKIEFPLDQYIKSTMFS